MLSSAPPAGVAQSVEQLIRNEKVGGSIPLTGTISGKGPASAGPFALWLRSRRSCRLGLSNCHHSPDYTAAAQGGFR